MAFSFWPRSHDSPFAHLPLLHLHAFFSSGQIHSLLSQTTPEREMYIFVSQNFTYPIPHTAWAFNMHAFIRTPNSTIQTRTYRIVIKIDRRAPANGNTFVLNVGREHLRTWWVTGPISHMSTGALSARPHYTPFIDVTRSFTASCHPPMSLT